MEHQRGTSETSSDSALSTTRFENKHGNPVRPILIIGKSGALGQGFARICQSNSLPYVLLGREDVDICKCDQIEKMIIQYNPWAIINASGYVRVDEAEADKANCFQINTAGPEKLAKACKKNAIRLLSFSSNLVFDGRKQSPYLESDPVCPLNIYGHSKAASETAILTVLPESLIIRTSAFFGPWDNHNFIYSLLEALEDGQPFYASTNIVSPTYIPHLVEAALNLLVDEAHGIWHLTNNTAVSWYDFARAAAAKAGLDPNLIIPKDLSMAARRPEYSAMDSEKGQLMPPLHAAIEAYFNEARIFA